MVVSLSVGGIVRRRGGVVAVVLVVFVVVGEKTEREEIAFVFAVGVEAGLSCGCCNIWCAIEAVGLCVVDVIVDRQPWTLC